MRVALVAAAGAALLLAGGAAGWLLAGGEGTVERATVVSTETTATTETVATTVSITQAADVSLPGQEELPAAVAETRIAVLAAATARDYEALERLTAEEFSYTFGPPYPGGPVAYWRNLEETTDEEPIATLAAILQMPYTGEGDIYAWPFAYARELDSLTPAERQILAAMPGFERLGRGTEQYLGYRAGIAPDGRWVFFVAGD